MSTIIMDEKLTIYVSFLSLRNILVGLQASNFACGVIGAFQADRGGQWLVYKPNLPSSGITSPERSSEP